jgi:UDP-4-amino-4,6-dideoxy-N-acetyl-beta-L-altrosamine N-acetyltransferase
MRLMDIVEALTFESIIGLDRDTQLQVLAIRNQPAIRHNMYTSHEIQESEHFAWIERLRKDSSTHFFAVFQAGRVIGGISLNAISKDNRRADWAYYIDVECQGHGVGSALEFKFLDYVFHHLNILKLNCEVFTFNERVISLHKKFGFQEEGLRRHHIRRGEEVLDICLLGITRDEWISTRQILKRRLFA